MAEVKNIAAEAVAENIEEQKNNTAGNENAADQQTRQRIIVTFAKPYVFEDKEYPEIDLTDLDKLIIQDAIDTQRQLFGEQEVAASILCETTTAFARNIAAKASGLPIEFFKLMPRGAMKRVLVAVRNYVNADGETVDHVMPLEKPYTYKGKGYESIDLTGVADLNSLHESEAENRIARAGFVVTENSTNYLYACVIASMATGLPEEFFTGLPLYEVIKLKNSVNDAGFFE